MYVVKINSGGARTQSIPLSSKAKVNAYVRRSPLGKWNTPIEIEDKRNKRIIKGIKVKFSRIKTNW